MKTKSWLPLTIGSCLMLVSLVPLYIFADLCDLGLYSSIAFPLMMLGATLTIRRINNEKAKNFLFVGLITLPLAYVFVTPIGMIQHAIAKAGSFQFFWDERLLLYAILEVEALILLALAAYYYTDAKSIRRGRLFSRLHLPLLAALLIRLFWITFMETRHLSRFSVEYSQLAIEYIVLISIPLLWAILVLTSFRIRLGYQLGIIVGLAHALLVEGLAVMNINPGHGPWVVASSSLAIAIFSAQGMVSTWADNGESMGEVATGMMRFMLWLKGHIENPTKPLIDAGVHENTRILDYGCGIGNYTLEAAKLAGPNGSVTAVDKDGKMLEVARKRIQRDKLANIQLVQATSLDEIEDQSYDFILLIDVLHLIADRHSLIDGLLRRLTSNGGLLIKLDHFDKQEKGRLLARYKEAGVEQLRNNWWLLNQRALA